MDEKQLVTHNPWQALRRFTNARIALGRTGDSLPTNEMLAFQLDHARARDAVHLAFDVAGLAAELMAQGFEVLQVQSAAPDRGVYLKRPDLGRQLSHASRQMLETYAAEHAAEYDAVFVIADGLSALAVQQHAVALCCLTVNALQNVGWKIAPIVIASQSRVALGDEIGLALRGSQVAMLIGERPGLSVADSLGVYLTYAPQPGRTDAERNCISNIHPLGLTYAAAQETLVYLMSQARRQKLTGVALKDDRAERDAAAQLPE
jgi:ethanolamine ammonia-lyase small subunit